MARTDIIHGDRRCEKRYESEMELRFSYRLQRGACLGCGRTVDLSRTAVRFLADDPPPEGVEVELRIAWPFLLQNVCPLELVVRGSVRNTTARGTVVKIEFYEFRTCGQRSFVQAAAAGGGRSFLA